MTQTEIPELEPTIRDLLDRINHLHDRVTELESQIKLNALTEDQDKYTIKQKVDLLWKRYRNTPRLLFGERL